MKYEKADQSLVDAIRLARDLMAECDRPKPPRRRIVRDISDELVFVAEQGVTPDLWHALGVAVQDINREFERSKTERKELRRSRINQVGERLDEVCAIFRGRLARRAGVTQAPPQL